MKSWLIIYKPQTVIRSKKEQNIAELRDSIKRPRRRGRIHTFIKAWKRKKERIRRGESNTINTHNNSKYKQS